MTKQLDLLDWAKEEKAKQESSSLRKDYSPAEGAVYLTINAPDLVPGEAVYLTSSGAITSDCPTRGIIQIIGIATDSRTVQLYPIPTGINR